MDLDGVPFRFGLCGASGLTLMQKNALRDRRALKFYTGKIRGAPARSIPLASTERPKLPIRVEYHSAQVEYTRTRPDDMPFEPSESER